MSLRPSPATAVPEETAKVVRAAFPRGCLLMNVRDSLGSVFDDSRFARLFSTRGRPAEAPWRLALVTLLQFAENLSDRDAADAVRARLDWKYVLALALDDPGFESTVLCEFRARLVDGHAEHELPDAVLAVAVAHRLVRPRGRQRTDSTHVLATVKMRSRIDAATEALRQALNVLAVAAPAWLLGQTRPHWADRYSGHGNWGHAAKARASRDGLLIEATRDFGVDLVGPTRPDLQWQARRGKGFAAAAFQVDWGAQHVTCPRGAKSSSWTASTEFGWETVKVKFSQADCKPCPNRADCAGPTASHRAMTLRDRQEFEALQAARKRERTPEFRAVHALRAGVEATLSQGVRGFGLRRARYVGLAKTRLQHVGSPALCVTRVVPNAKDEHMR